MAFLNKMSALSLSAKRDLSNQIAKEILDSFDPTGSCRSLGSPKFLRVYVCDRHPIKSLATFRSFFFFFVVVVVVVRAPPPSSLLFCEIIISQSANSLTYVSGRSSFMNWKWHGRNGDETTHKRNKTGAAAERSAIIARALPLCV